MKTGLVDIPAKEYIVISEDRFAHRHTIHEFNSTIQPIYQNLNHSAILCVFLSWLARYALSRLLSLLQNSIQFMESSVRCERLATPNVDTGMRLQIEHNNVNCASPLNDRRMWLAASLSPNVAKGADKRQQVRILPDSTLIPGIFKGWMRYVAPQAHIRNNLVGNLGVVLAYSGRITDLDNSGISRQWIKGLTTGCP